jgi:hypothetical protein
MRALIHALLIGLILGSAVSPAASQSAPGDTQIAAAVQALRTRPAVEPSGRDPYLIWQTETQALNTLGSSGQAGVRAVKEEMQRIDRAGESDDRFKAAAAFVMWSAGGADEAEAIATLWSTSECSKHFGRVLGTAIAAAQTHDERVLPILVAVLRMRHPADTVMGHAASYPPPEVLHGVVWDAYGSKGTPVLVKLVEESTDEALIASAVALLGSRYHLESLPRIRSLAVSGSGEVRSEAIKALGLLGHPQDFEFLAGGVKASPASADPFVIALGRYGDLRAVPLLIPLLPSGNPPMTYSVAEALMELPTADGLAALASCVKSSGSSALGARCNQDLSTALRLGGATPEDFANAGTPVRERMALAARQWTDNLLAGTSGAKFTHEDLVTTARRWIAAGRVTGSGEWVGDFASVATVDDIPLLIDLRGALSAEMTHEALGAGAGASMVLERVSRGRYRANPGVCEMVQPRK